MKKTALLSGAVVAALASAAGAQTFGPGPGGAIPDRGVAGSGPPTLGTLSSTIIVPAGTGTIISFDNISLTMGVGPGATGAHTWVGDLVATLTAPNGDSAQFLVRPGGTSSTSFGNSADFSGGPYVFVNSGGLPFPTASPPTPVPPGTYNRFNNPLVTPNPPTDTDDFTVFHGDTADGTWTLEIGDWAGGDTGGLASWSLTVTVPEPGSIGLLSVAAGLPLLRRRRRA